MKGQLLPSFGGLFFEVAGYFAACDFNIFVHISKVQLEGNVK